MKIRIRENDRTYRFWIPGWLLWGPATRWMLRVGMKTGKRYLPETLQGLTPEKVEMLLLELRRIKRSRSTWELVDVQSADGTYIKIVL